jgi:predicted signal transduction protein with EAL and GGDEF domain
VGTDAARQLNSSPIAALMRSLGSPERVYGEIATAATKYSVATRLETVDSGPGFAEIIATPADGFPRSADHCAWSRGLLSQPTILFGMVMGASIGRATFPQDAPSAEQLLSHADAAMFAHKRRHSGVV